MKKILIATVALAFATPVLASDQLALSLGVEPGQYTLDELVALKAVADEEGNDGKVNLENLARFASQSAQDPVFTGPASQ